MEKFKTFFNSLTLSLWRLLPRHLPGSLVYSFRSYILVSYIFRFCVLFRFVFVFYMVCGKSQKFILLHVDIQLSWQHLLKALFFFPVKLCWPLCPQRISFYHMPSCFSRSKPLSLFFLRPGLLAPSSTPFCVAQSSSVFQGW